MKNSATLAVLAFAVFGSVPSSASEAVAVPTGNLLQWSTAQTPFGHTALMQRQHRVHAAASKGMQSMALVPVQGEGMQDFDNFGWLTVRPEFAQHGWRN